NHVFDATKMPPKQMMSIRLRDQPGWITFSIDGRHAYPSTGDVMHSDETHRGHYVRRDRPSWSEREVIGEGLRRRKARSRGRSVRHMSEALTKIWETRNGEIRARRERCFEAQLLENGHRGFGCGDSPNSDQRHEVCAIRINKQSSTIQGGRYAVA